MLHHLWIASASFPLYFPAIIFVLRKKGSKTKERMKEEEIEKGVSGRRPEKSFSEILSDLNQVVPNHLADESQTR